MNGLLNYFFLFALNNNNKMDEWQVKGNMNKIGAEQINLPQFVWSTPHDRWEGKEEKGGGGGDEK